MDTRTPRDTRGVENGEMSVCHRSPPLHSVLQLDRTKVRSNVRNKPD